MSERAALFPLFLKLEGKRCLVVGAGLIGLEKVESLLRCGASIRLVAPHAVTRIQELNAQGQIDWQMRAYEPADVLGCDLVIAATNDREVNRAGHDALLVPQSGVACVVETIRRVWARAGASPSLKYTRSA